MDAWLTNLHLQIARLPTSSVSTVPSFPHQYNVSLPKSVSYKDRSKRKNTFVRCYNCDAWFSSPDLLMEHKAEAHPMEEAARKLGLKLVKNRVSGTTAAIIPSSSSYDMQTPSRHLPVATNVEKNSTTTVTTTSTVAPKVEPVPDLDESADILNRLRSLSIKEKSRARRFKRNAQQQNLSSNYGAQNQELSDVVQTCTCGAVLPDLPLVRRLHMRTNHDALLHRHDLCQLSEEAPDSSKNHLSVGDLSFGAPKSPMFHHAQPEKAHLVSSPISNDNNPLFVSSPLQQMASTANFLSTSSPFTDHFGQLSFGRLQSNDKCKNDDNINNNSIFSYC